MMTRLRQELGLVPVRIQVDHDSAFISEALDLWAISSWRGCGPTWEAACALPWELATGGAGPFFWTRGRIPDSQKPTVFLPGPNRIGKATRPCCFICNKIALKAAGPYF